MKKKIHAESLMQIPLVRWMRENFSFSERAIDHRWHYQKAAPATFGGFQPFSGKIYYGTNSCFAEWLKNSYGPTRDLNQNDNLVKEVLFAVHDALHIWSIGEIQKFKPKLGFGIKPIDRKNIKDFLFCHLLTEATAVCGLDYWFLSKNLINDYCDIGTNVRSLTVNYFEEDRSEYLKFHPNFNPQQKSFLMDLTNFYCTGEFEGFDVGDFRKSPKLVHWLIHELRYGVNQRNYAKDWFSFLSGDAHLKKISEITLSASESWQQELANKIANQLWNLAHGKNLKPHTIKWSDHWKAPKNTFDFRFSNLNAMKAQTKRPMKSDFEMFFYQFMVKHNFDSFPEDRAPLLKKAMESGKVATVKSVFKNVQKLRSRNEPKDLFLLP
jgi:hypothetical protein